MTERWYEAGLRFECTGCARCCRTHGEHAYVYLAPADVDAISDHLGMKRLDFLNTHCACDPEGWTYLTMVEGDCNFLDPGGRCVVYPVRPKQCETWPFWTENILHEKRWHDAIAAFCPGVNRGKCYSADEVDEIAEQRDEWYAE